MEIRFSDYRGSDELFSRRFSAEWADIEDVLRSTHLHLKASDQKGLKGNPIFDVVGTNHAIHDGLTNRGWSSGLPIPSDFSFLGKDVDYGKGPILIEVQFSNYPFLLNNTLRSELFFKSQVSITGEPVQAVVIVTKGWMFPASNSTLYYEQAEKQLTALANHSVFDVPIRLVGLFSHTGRIPAIWTDYHSARYSRTVVGQRDVECMVSLDPSGKSRATIRVARL